LGDDVSVEAGGQDQSRVGVPRVQAGEARTSIVIPAVNEAENLPHVLPAIPRSPDIVEVILVDGSSVDDTVSVARSCLPDIRVVRQSGKGKSEAIRCGVRVSQGDYVLIMDADVSHDPRDIPRFIELARKGYDVVKGSRYLPGGRSHDHTPLRRFLVGVTDVVANVLWGTKLNDIVFGMFLIRRQAFLDLHLTSNGFALEAQAMARAGRRGYRISEIPVVEKPRLHGRSRLSIVRDGWYIGSTVFLEFFHRLTLDAFTRRVTQIPLPADTVHTDSVAVSVDD